MKCAYVLLLLLALPSMAHAQSVIGVRDDLSLQVDRIFSAYDRTDSPGCAVGVYRDGRIVYARGYGMANLELGVPITPRTVFNIGSVSKVFTAKAVVLLAQDGKLSLDDPISRFFPEMAPYATGITVRHLLNHTSGLHEYYNLQRLAGIGGGSGNPRQRVHLITRSTATNFPPGTRAEYSNSGYIMAGEIVSRVSGQSVAMFLKSRVFDPLGMADTRMHEDERVLIPGRAQGYDVLPGVGVRTARPTDVNQTGDGGVWTSLEDFARWDRNWDTGTVGGRVLGDSLVVQAKLRDGPTHRYALGGSLEVFRGLRTYTKDGNDLGYTATYRRFLDQRLAVATLCNLDVATDPLTRQVAAVYLKSQLAPDAPVVPNAWGTALLAEPAVRVPVEDLRPLESWWSNEESGEMNSTRVVDGQLVVGQAGQLVPLGGGRFRVPGPATVELVFEGNGPKGPQRLRIRNPLGTRTLERKDIVRLTEKQLAEYAGEYRSDEIETTHTIVADATDLVVRTGNRWLGRLEPIWHDRFHLVNSPVPPSVLPVTSSLGDRQYSFQFTRDPRGRIVGFAIHGRADRGVRNLPFVRRP